MTVEGSIIDVGTEDNIASDAVIVDADGNDVTDNYEITYVPGILEVTKSTKALIISSATKSWEYDGELHYENVYTVMYEGEVIEPDESGMVFTLPTEDTIIITPAAAGVMYVSDSAEANNSFSYILTHADHFDGISVAFGTLSITPAPLTITADSKSKTYDGTPLTDDGWQDTPPEGLKGTDEVVSVTVTGTITDPGVEENIPSDAVIMNGDVDVTENYDITYVNGVLKVIRKGSPSTGDHSMIYAASAVMSIIVAIALIIDDRKRRAENR